MISLVLIARIVIIVQSVSSFLVYFSPLSAASVCVFSYRAVSYRDALFFISSQIQDTTSDPLMAKAIIDRVRSVDDTALAFKVNC